MINIEVLTLFPKLIETFAKTSIMGKASEKAIINISPIDIREYTLDKHRRVDDYPFGGGVGMLMQAEPIFRCLEDIGASKKKLVYMSPKGKTLGKGKVVELSKVEDLVILCGHYEGIDERVIEYWDIEEISVGDYILTGGETAAMVLIDSVIRTVPMVLGHEDSAMQESIYSGLLEHPQYTKPRDFRNLEVPPVLWSGNHKAIELWQLEQSMTITKERRPDLWKKFKENFNELSNEEKKIMEKVDKLL